MMDPILSMLGICRKAGKIQPGEEPVDAAVRARDARLLLLAADAADNTARRCARFAEVGQCLWLRIPESKYELGRALGRGSCAILAITDTGLALAVAQRLAEQNICVRAGLHCAPLAHKTAGTERTGTVRISPGWFQTERQMRRFAARIAVMSGKESSQNLE